MNVHACRGLPQLDRGPKSDKHGPAGGDLGQHRRQLRRPSPAAGLLLALILVLICFVQSSEERKLPKVKTSTLEGSLIMSALPKGTIIPPSSPSDRGNAVITGGELFGIQPTGHVDRNLQSVPSPGVGH
ncbi:Uncharacterized protein Fot_40247 [Forsythia ovata]|uniref:Uncharacterized protein n=1 Tax=Forsythia ovata TaxID=205694 RepID=A0ABD1S735_9LAMI